jgi:hypothetical protein
MALLLDEAGADILDEAGGDILDEVGGPSSGPGVLYAAQVPADAGQQIAMAPPDSQTGDTAPTGTGVALLVFNGGASGITVTLPVGPAVDGLAIASRTVAVAAGAVVLIPVPSSVYGMQPTGISYSSTVSVTVAMVGLA